MLTTQFDKRTHSRRPTDIIISPVQHQPIDKRVHHYWRPADIISPPPRQQIVALIPQQHTLNEPDALAEKAVA